METELFHAERRTDMTKLIVAFRHFANAPKNRQMYVLFFASLYVIRVYRKEAFGDT